MKEKYRDLEVIPSKVAIHNFCDFAQSQRNNIYPLSRGRENWGNKNDWELGVSGWNLIFLEGRPSSSLF